MFRDELFDLLFVQDYFNAQSCVRGNRPYDIIHTKDRSETKIVHYALGVNETDIKIDVTPRGYKDYLLIEGVTKNEDLDREFSIKSMFEIQSNRIDSIDWSTKDGVITVTIKWKKRKSDFAINHLK